MKKFFLSDLTFKLFTFLGVVLLIPSTIWSIIYNASQGIFVVLITLLLSIAFTYRSYVRHEKNVMKCLIGMILACIIIDNCLSLCYILPVANIYDIVIELLLVLVDIVFVVNHLVINSDHHSSPKQVRLNQYLAGLEMLLIIIAVIPYFNTIVNGPFDIFMLVCDTLGFISIFIFITCIESRLDAYRIEREIYGWEPEDSR